MIMLASQKSPLGQVRTTRDISIPDVSSKKLASWDCDSICDNMNIMTSLFI